MPGRAAMASGEINLLLAASGGGEGHEVAVRGESGLFIASRAVGHLLVEARDHVVHEDAEALGRTLGVGDERAVRADAGFGIVGAFLAHAGDSAGVQILQEDLGAGTGRVGEASSTPVLRSAQPTW